MFCFTKETCTTLIYIYQTPLFTTGSPYYKCIWQIYTLHHSNKRFSLDTKGMASKDFQYEQTASNHSKALLKHSFLHRSSDLHLEVEGIGWVHNSVGKFITILSIPLKTLNQTFNNMHDKHFITINKCVIMSNMYACVCWFHHCFSPSILSQLINCWLPTMYTADINAPQDTRSI